MSLFSFGILWLLAAPVLAQEPQWIWVSPEQDRQSAEQFSYFRKVFTGPAYMWNARLSMAADDSAEIFLNGKMIATCPRYDQPVRAEVSMFLRQGENVIAVRARNTGGPKGLLVHLTTGGDQNRVIVSDSSWLASTAEEKGWDQLLFNAAHWKPAVALGPHGMAPWGDVLQKPAPAPAENISTLPGFAVELVRAAEPGEGSWICLAFDQQGRLIISPEGDTRPLLRLKINAAGRVEELRPLLAPVRYAMGLLAAHGSLYANARGPEGSGLYRLRDENRNDLYETNELTLLKKVEGGSEHGYHALALGPDDRIYVLNGNGTKLPAGLNDPSPHRNYAEDMLSPRPDHRHDSEGAKPPAGYVLRTDAEGKEWELWMGGLRNSYDFDFNAEGELFTFDSDMEWDWGAPWYRLTRIVHCVQGGEYGWRDGTRMWPDDYPDMLPPALSIGLGSPTGVKFGAKSNFPEKYKRALFVMDWSYGRILAVQLKPSGATYEGSFETFAQGRPLNLTSMAFGPDGALYFVTGGRGTQSGLYRIRYTGADSASAPDPSQEADAAARARNLRHNLEKLQREPDPDALRLIWPQLGSKDRFISFAARLALEAQSLADWKKRALNERNPAIGLNALIAFCRMTTGDTNAQAEMAEALERFKLTRLDNDLHLAKLRVIELSFIRHGPPREEWKQALQKELSGVYPTADWPLNRELSRLLVYLGATDVLSKTLALLDQAPSHEQQLHYVNLLRYLPAPHWTIDDRGRFLAWWRKPRLPLAHPPELLQAFADVGRVYVDGAWLERYRRDFHADLVASLTATEKEALGSLTQLPQNYSALPVSNRPFVKEWKTAELLPDLSLASQGRDFARGRQIFAEAQCLSCHRFGNDGGMAGSELTAAGSKYSRRDLLEAMTEPSKVILEQYQDTMVILEDGDVLSGRLISQSAEEIVLETDRMRGTRQEINRKKIREQRSSTLSPMPEGLLNAFTKEEIFDLLAYLESGGNRDHAVYQKREGASRD